MEVLSAEQAGVLFGVAIVSGAINSVAGGGSFLSFPALLMLGVPPIQANATNTMALWPGILGSIGAYRGELRGSEAKRVLGPLLATSCVGGILGAITLLVTPQQTFLRLIPFLLLGATLLFAFSRKITSALKPGGEAALTTRGGATAQLFVAFYIGYFGAGAGILMMALLALLGLEQIHRINAYKTVQAAVGNGVALLAFAARNVIYWRHAGIMLAGAILGGYGGAWMAQNKMKQEHVRWVVIAIGFGMSAYFFLRRG